MNSIILCEGETDQILISYYFIEHFKFKHCNKLPSIAPQKLNPHNDAEKIYYYRRNNDNLIIWAVGGHNDVFENALRSILNRNKLNSPTGGKYSRICVVTDHDSDNELTNFWSRINQCLTKYGIEAQIQNATWVETEQNTDFNETMPISILGLPVPLNEDGALETLLLNALNDDAGNSYIVEKSRDVIHHLLANANKFSDHYLSTRREKIKAPLAVFLAITIPERTFVEMDAIMKSIPWGNYQAIKDFFAPFDVFKQKESHSPCAKN